MVDGDLSMRFSTTIHLRSTEEVNPYIILGAANREESRSTGKPGKLGNEHAAGRAMCSILSWKSSLFASSA
jgi:hypothetical protein